MIEDSLKFKSKSGENYQYIAVFILLLRPTRKASPLSFKFIINLTETTRCVLYLPQFEHSHFGVEQVLGHPCILVCRSKNWIQKVLQNIWKAVKVLETMHICCFVSKYPLLTAKYPGLHSHTVSGVLEEAQGFLRVRVESVGLVRGGGTSPLKTSLFMHYFCTALWQYQVSDNWTPRTEFSCIMCNCRRNWSWRSWTMPTVNQKHTSTPTCAALWFWSVSRWWWVLVIFLFICTL